MADLTNVIDPRMQQMVQALMQQNNPQMQQAGDMPGAMQQQQQMLNTPYPPGMLNTQPPGKDQSRFMPHPFPPPPNLGQSIMPPGMSGM